MPFPTLDSRLSNGSKVNWGAGLAARKRELPRERSRLRLRVHHGCKGYLTVATSRAIAYRNG